MRREVLAALMSLISFPALAASASARAGDEAAIRSYLDLTLHAKGVAFRAAEAQLSGSARKEIIVHVTGPAFCGSGGCETLVLKRTPRGFRTVMNATLTWPPIRVLKTRTQGWRDIGVMVAGGGTASSYEARMRFDGRRYPSNPTVPPARPMARITGEIVIPEKVR